MGGAIRSFKKSIGGLFGGGSTPTPAAYTTNEISVNSVVGGVADTAGETQDKEKKKISTINKKKLGTTGAQIPLASTATSPAGGIQI